MRAFPIALLAATTLALAQPATAAIVVGTFSGTVTEGQASGAFGFDTPTDLAGKAITGTFRYDTALLGPDCTPGQAFLGCFLGTGMSITQTIDGVDEVFAGSPVFPGTGLEFNAAESGLLLYNLGNEAANLHTRSGIGTPATHYSAHETGMSFGLTSGAISDANNPVLFYNGSADGPLFSYRSESGQRFTPNHSEIIRITGGVIKTTTYDFTVDRVTFGAAVPEPGTWALMILGFGAAGAALRRRHRIMVRAA